MLASHFLEVRLQFWLGEIIVLPYGGFEKFLVPREAVDDAFDVTPRSGIAIPKPCATNISCRVNGNHVKPKLLNEVQGVKPGKTSACDQRIMVFLHDETNHTLTGLVCIGDLGV